MIQPTGHNRIQKAGRGNMEEETIIPGPKKEKPINKKMILNIYEKYLQASSPTYGEDIKNLMKKENIQQTNLNAKIIETMGKEGVNLTKNNLEIIVSQLQKDHLFQLFQDGYDLESLTIDIIAKEINQDGQALPAEELILTDKNIEVLEGYKDKLESIIKDNGSIISNMVRLKLELTINNLYAAKHSGKPKNTARPPTEEEIIAILNMNGIKVSQENMNAVRNLMGGKIEITRENIKSYRRIQGAINHIDLSKLLEKAAKEIKKGENPGDLIISSENVKEFDQLEYDEIKQIIEDIKHMDQEVVEKTYSKEKPITIGNLQQTLYENIEKALKNDQLSDLENKDNQGKEEINEKIEVSKRQLEEIRLSLTLKAALKLNNKLDIKTTDLTKLVEELKLIEREQKEDILRATQTPVTEENIDQMQQTNEKLYNISLNKGLAATKVIQGESDFTLKGMDEAIQLKYVQDSYQEIATRPERRFGEGIAKIEEQIEHILALNKIEATPSNMKAAKALIENNIDLTIQSVEDAKQVLLKIERVIYELRPGLVAQMLQEGIRPDTVHVDELINYINQIQKDKLIDPKQKLAEAILELDQSNQLSPKEREGLIGVYRMLNTITKNETAAIGFLLDKDKEVTLGNLFEASKYIKRLADKSGNMDVIIDDDLGLRQGDLPENIRSLIKEAAGLSLTEKDINSWLNTKNIIDQWLSRITPEELKSYLDMDKSLEELVLKENKLSTFEAEQTTKQGKSLGKLSPHTLNVLKENNISLTIPNIYWTDKMIKNPYLLRGMLRDYENLTGEKIKSAINNGEDRKNIDEILDQLENEVNEQSAKWMLLPERTQAYRVGRDLQQILTTQKQISQNEGMYQIPVALHDGMSNLNIYVMKDKEGSNEVEKDELRAYMSIKTKHMGIIRVNMRISDRALAFEMIGENPEITLALQKDSKELKDAIENIGYNVMQAKFSQGKPQLSLAEKPKPSKSLEKYKFAESKFEHII